MPSPVSPDPTGVHLRSATMQDAEPIARVHLASWDATYRGLVPDALLAELTFERRLAQWRHDITHSLEPGGAGCVAVADAGTSGIVGFASAGPEREPEAPFDGELYTLYLLASHQGRGIGAALLRYTATQLRRSGCRSMRAWVLEGNPTEGFYRRMGGRPAGSQALHFGEHDLTEVAYGWSDLGALAAEER
jgi:GNAT superfamily N-acetyltransferase